MHHQLRRKDRAWDDESAHTLLVNSEYGVLSTADSHNQPYGVPVNYAVSDNSIYIHSATAGHKIENIALNTKVSFCVVGNTRLIPEEFSTDYESVVVFGRASMIDGDEKIAALRALIRKYSPEQVTEGEAYITKHLKKTAIIKIFIDHYSGKARK
ncbi:MAG: pyridoxamine 5'-phosphate oxidase family protein [Desulfobacteraceae bacterium]|nr:pyridoxamine 5'-phosphate oxidase family protein [Desulfobacteraceae bacterium]